MNIDNYLKKTKESEVCVYSLKDLQKGNPLNNFQSFPKYILDIGKHINEYIIEDEEEYLLKGVSISFDDFYYILEDKNGKIHYSSCVGNVLYK